MRIGASLLLIAAGAILRFAITPQYSHGINWGTVGVILMVVGIVGAVITGIFLTARRRTDVTYRGMAVPPRAGYPVAAPVDPRYSSATYVEPAPLDPGI
jgi:hypothetical protein